ncbi:MAG TPA: valine--tRNA ligase, partial [bacterium]|nr:valine--tRNA ligase [bacterium]
GSPGSIMVQRYPSGDGSRKDPAVEAKFASLQELVRAVRTIRAEFTIPPDRKIDVAVLADTEVQENFESHRQLVAHLTGSRQLSISPSGRADGARNGSIAAAGKGFEVFVLIREAIDAPKELARLAKDREKAESEKQRTEAKLATSAFVDRAPKEIVDREKEKLAELSRRIQKIEGYVRALSG